MSVLADISTKYRGTANSWTESLTEAFPKVLKPSWRWRSSNQVVNQVVKYAIVDCLDTARRENARRRGINVSHFLQIFRPSRID